jgi:hypothetical protein
VQLEFVASQSSSTVKHIRHYRYRNFWEWQNKLVKEGFLKIHSASETRALYSLKPPLQILIASQVVERVKQRYKPDREIGGILLAEPVKIGIENMLLIDHLRFIRNVSKDPRNYQARGDRTQHMHRCLMGTKNCVRYFPIWFHSHPRKSKDLPESIMAFFEMGTSDADKRMATRKIAYSHNANYLTFAFPSALVVVTQDDKTFVGVYGGFITPEDFREYVQKLLGKSMEAIISWSLKGESIWRMIAGILGGLSIGFVGAISHSGFRALATQIAIVRKELDADPNYFAVSENHDLRIIIPERS